jgi:hypothetical protein
MATRDVAIFIKAIDKASKVLEGVSKTGTRAFKAFGKAALGVGVAVTGAGVAYGALIKSGIAYNAQMERYQATLETTMKSQERATKQIIWAKKFAAETPFEIPEIIESTVRLETYGITAQKTLKQIGNMAAIMGKPLMQAIEAIADAQSGELERLKEFGIDKRKLVAAGLEVESSGAIKDMEQLNEMLFKIMEERYEGGMKKMMKGFVGLVSNLKDTWGQITGTIAEPVFDQVKIDLKILADAIDSFKKTGKLDKMLKSWGVAGANAFKIITTALKQTAPAAIQWLQQVGTNLAEFTSRIDIDKVISFTKNIIGMIKAIVRVTIQVTSFVIENWKLVAALAAMTIIAKITSMILTMAKSIGLVVVAIKGWIVANVALLASLGPTGLILALIAATTALAIWITKSDKATKSATELGKAMATKEMERFGDETANMNSRIAMAKILLVDANKESKKQEKHFLLQYTLLKANIIKYKEFLVAQDALVKAVAYTHELTVALKKLQEQHEAAQKAGELVGPPVPKGFYEAQKLKKKQEQAYQTLRIVLEKEYTAFTQSEWTIRAMDMKSKYDGMIKQAKGGAKTIKLIERNRTLAFERFYAEEAVAFAEAEEKKRAEVERTAIALERGHKSAYRTLHELMGNEQALRSFALNEAYKTVLEETNNVKLAQAVIDQMKAKYAIDDKKRDDELRLTKEQNARAVQIAILEADGKTFEARKLRVQSEIETIKDQGATEAEIKQFTAFRIAQIDKEAADAKAKRIEADNKKLLREEEKTAKEIERIHARMNSRLMSLTEDSFNYMLANLSKEVVEYRQKGADRVLIAQWEAAETEKIKRSEVDRIIALETEKINAMDDQYQGYIDNAFQLGEILFSAQDQGWSTAIANLIRWGSQMAAEYIRTIAYEKLRQAAELKTNFSYISHLKKKEGTNKKYFLLTKAMEKEKQAEEDTTQSKFLRAHASKMAALAAEYQARALAAAASMNFVAMAKYEAAAFISTKTAVSDIAQSAIFAGQATALKAEAQVIRATAISEEIRYNAQAEQIRVRGEVAAKALEVEAKGLMIGAAAIESAGEVTARIIEQASRAEKARKQVLEEEKQLQNEILIMQGKEHTVRMAQIGDESREFGKTGIDAAVISEWKKLRENEEITRALEAGEVIVNRVDRESNAGLVRQETVIQPTIISDRDAEGRTIVSGADVDGIVRNTGTVINQYNHFYSLIDTARQDDLRELAFKLHPFNQEIEELTRDI